MTRGTSRDAPERTLSACVQDFRRLLEEGKPLEAIERYYAPHVSVFENRELARAGRDRCIQHEKTMLARVASPPVFRVRHTAIDEKDDVAFLEYVIRFTAEDGRPMRIEEVAVQIWENGAIVEERFYYEGVVDEGDEDDVGD